MGMYDNVLYPCFWCGKENYAQTKILGNLTLMNFEIGDEFLVDEDEGSYNCVLSLKDKCEKCGKETAIIIKDGKFVGVENSKYANCVEGHWGSYEFDDELTEIMKEKLKRIENGRKRTKGLGD